MAVSRTGRAAGVGVEWIRPTLRQEGSQAKLTPLAFDAGCFAQAHWEASGVMFVSNRTIWGEAMRLMPPPDRYSI